MTLHQYSVDNFKKFLDELLFSKDININTARNLKNSSSRLLTVINSDESEDVTKINLDEIVVRFAETLDPVPTHKSLATYKNRFQKALSYFIEDASSKIPNSRTRPKSVKPNLFQTTSALKAKEIEIKTFKLPIPLRKDFIVEINNLPQDLTSEEADRIATIIKSYALAQ
ncbi:hypothetical protein ABN063_05765 [Providencia vermicola]|uniref:hypothetical protein n=1 Tax=Providencia vermicola TaxID=333965 RepID=UPI0032DA0C7B